MFQGCWNHQPNLFWWSHFQTHRVSSCHDLRKCGWTRDWGHLFILTFFELMTVGWEWQPNVVSSSFHHFKFCVLMPSNFNPLWHIIPIPCVWGILFPSNQAIQMYIPGLVHHCLGNSIREGIQVGGPVAFKKSSWDSPNILMLFYSGHLRRMPISWKIRLRYVEIPSGIEMFSMLMSLEMTLAFVLSKKLTLSQCWTDPNCFNRNLRGPQMMSMGSLTRAQLTT